MVNDFYERTGWLYKFLNPENQPLLIREYLQKENEYLMEHIGMGGVLLDVGCGFGRHLNLLVEKCILGVGVDIDKLRITDAKENLRNFRNIFLFLADAVNIPLASNSLDFIICMNNTFGNLFAKKEQALREMKRLIKHEGLIIISIHSIDAIPIKVQWYERTGMRGVTLRNYNIHTEEGFISENFSQKYLEDLFFHAGFKFEILRLNEISYACRLYK